MVTIKQSVINRLIENSAGKVDKKGYFYKLSDNILQCIELDDFKCDLVQGSGNELETNF